MIRGGIAAGGRVRARSVPVVPEQDVQSGQRAELQRSLILTQEGGEDGYGVGENRPQVNLQG